MKLCSIDLKMGILGKVVTVHLIKDRKVLAVAVNIKSTDRSFRMKDHSVSSYKQGKPELSCFFIVKQLLRMMEITPTH